MSESVVPYFIEGALALVCLGGLLVILGWCVLDYLRARRNERQIEPEQLLQRWGKRQRRMRVDKAPLVDERSSIDRFRRESGNR